MRAGWWNETSWAVHTRRARAPTAIGRELERASHGRQRPLRARAEAACRNVRPRDRREAHERLRRFWQAAAAHHQCICLWRCVAALGAAGGNQIAGYGGD